MDKTVRNLAIGLVALIILAPLGLLAVGETFGEWGNEELEEKIGFVPSGLERLSSLWSAPMPDYALPGIGESMTAASAAYILSAVIGVVICAGLLYIIGKRIAKD
ncbi:MAG: cobalt transport protein CbiM [Euryarchaeota archaeon ADurb.Bin190]|jgi:cobalt/nickel transport system permease protein/cobalt/nickel transport protein|nr:MAG: cobalt transport protein CbiM [Euryarchaeota archaeon ADurb.Bin190]HNU39942.1 PDGLE domain-containing protein [Methanothrix sp.]HPA98022.1 PDGLE domain-containing protein [Methanothrix sp.]HQQ37730.1 PDGLE domain-containing protein [Methanothrix sp.]